MKIILGISLLFIVACNIEQHSGQKELPKIEYEYFLNGVWNKDCKVGEWHNSSIVICKDFTYYSIPIRMKTN